MRNMQMVKLSDMFTLQMGKTPSRDNSAYWNGTHKWVAIADLGKATKYIVDTKECITDLAVSETGIKATPKNTVVMSFKLSIGKTAITTEEIYTNEAIMSFVDKGIYDFDIDYIYYLFSGKDWSEGTNKAVMGVTLNKATLSQISIPLPPLEIQKQIACTLDKVTHTIDTCNAILEKLDLLVKSRFIELFGDPVENPFQWDTIPLENACQSIVDCPHSTPSYTFENTGYMCIRTSIVKKNAILWDKIEYIPKDEYDQRIKRRKPQKGDIIYTREGAILGIAAIIDKDCNVALGQRSMLLSPNTKICLPEFISSAMNFDSFFNRVTEGVSGSASPHINVADIRAFGIMIPPIDLQEQFAAFVGQTDKSKLAVKQVLEKAETLKKALMQEYFG